jgi:hypothetical protein
MLLEFCGKAAEMKTQVYEWHKHFHNGCGSVNDDLPYRQLRQMINALNMCAVLCKVTEKKGTWEISAGSIHSIFHKDCNMHYHCQHSV